MKHDQIWNAVNDRYKADKASNPGFPDHVCGQVAVVAAPCGDMTRLAIEKKYKKDLRSEEVYNKMLESAALDTIVAAIRFLENLN